MERGPCSWPSAYRNLNFRPISSTMSAELRPPPKVWACTLPNGCCDRLRDTPSGCPTAVEDVVVVVTVTGAAEHQNRSPRLCLRISGAKPYWCWVPVTRPWTALRSRSGAAPAAYVSSSDVVHPTCAPSRKNWKERCESVASWCPTRSRCGSCSVNFRAVVPIESEPCNSAEPTWTTWSHSKISPTTTKTTRLTTCSCCAPTASSRRLAHDYRKSVSYLKLISLESSDLFVIKVGRLYMYYVYCILRAFFFIYNVFLARYNQMAINQ